MTGITKEQAMKACRNRSVVVVKSGIRAGFVGIADHVLTLFGEDHVAVDDGNKSYNVALSRIEIGGAS